MFEDELYKKRDGMLLRCVSQEDILKILVEGTPFGLVYGSEAVLPGEAGIPTYRQIGFNEEENDQRIREQTNFVNELRDRAFYKMKKYKHLMARTYNRRVKDKQFKVGDLVLRFYANTAT
ncbi:hypothetical protein LIER_01896 [Lithospermum erythrorhizon]|uniref:Uncharacterized protein n=1 Tax=Lithospermum erythrorhizon TaxID=34254 RepID=A0AAV3NMM9_LITER